MKMSLQVENNNTPVTAKDLPRQEFLLPFTPVINIHSDDQVKTSQNPPQMLSNYEYLHRMWDYASFDWKISDDRNSVVWFTTASPAGLAGLFKSLSIANLHLHFNYDLIFSFEIRSTVQHAGALAAVWLPPSFVVDGKTADITADLGYPSSAIFNDDKDQFFSNYFPVIMNQQENKTYEFRMPLKCFYDRWYTRPNKHALWYTPIGNLVIFVYSPLNTATNIVSLPVQVRYRLENVEFDTPTYSTPK